MNLGIDVAAVGAGKSIDWQKARAAGVSFAFLRAAYGSTPDKIFVREWPRAKAAGIVCGPYLFWRAAKDPDSQAMVLLSTISDAGGLQPGDLPPVIDVEFPGEGIRATGLAADEAVRRVCAVRKSIRTQYRVEPIIYTSARVWKEDLKDHPAPELWDCPLWLARYPYRAGPWRQPPPAPPPVPAPWGGMKEPDRFWFHQYQGDASGLPGFPSGKVDMNRFNLMMKGAKGARVRWVQARLGMETTGIFDANMDSAVRLLQQKLGLVADGIIGPRTFAYVAGL